MDKCGCCQVCGRAEHQLCDVNQEERKYGVCGDNLICIQKPEVNFILAEPIGHCLHFNFA